MSLTICYITARPQPMIEWLWQSLLIQKSKVKIDQIIVVDFYQPRNLPIGGPFNWKIVPIKPCVWQGPHKLVKGEWFSNANARNTGLCFCESDWLANLDDRCVLEPNWLDAIRDAMSGGYGVCGPYQKRTGITVENGTIRHSGIVTGEDNRRKYVKEHYSDPRHKLTNPYNCPGAWWYGCSTALPTEWALKVNGWPEECDGAGGEDYGMGQMLENNGFPLRYDLRMAIIEDRTPEFLGPTMIRKDKGVSPNDRSHWLLAKLKRQKSSQHQWNMRQLRDQTLAGIPFPIPMFPNVDPYDGEPLCQMTPP